jgi:hypothetical protein
MKGGVASFNVSIDYHIINENIKGEFNKVYLTSKDIDASLLYTDKLFKNVILGYLAGAYKTRTNIIDLSIITVGENGLPNYPESHMEFVNGTSKIVYNFLSSLKNQYTDIRINITLKKKTKLKTKKKSKTKSKSSSDKKKYKSNKSSSDKKKSKSNKSSSDKKKSKSKSKSK